jgi:hypothetical protein
MHHIPNPRQPPRAPESPPGDCLAPIVPCKTAPTHGIGTSLHDEVSQVSEAELQRELDVYLVGQPDAGRNGRREEAP